MVWYTLTPAGPQLTNGCFQTRAWPGGRLAGTVGRQDSWQRCEGKVPGITGRRRVWDTYKSDRLSGYSWVGKGRNQCTHTNTELRILIRVYLRELLDTRHKTIFLPRDEVQKIRCPWLYPRHQLESSEPHYPGIAFMELYTRCRTEFLVTSDLGLRAQVSSSSFSRPRFYLF